MLEGLFDTYGRKARLYPALLTILPAFVLMSSYTSLLELNWTSAGWAAFLAATLFFLADFSRKAGKNVEKKLLKEWGRFPSVTMLRHRDATISSILTKRYHVAASSLLTDIELPTNEAEKNDPVAADDVYEVVSNALLARTRDTSKFSILFKENINYGFRRNLLGLKPVALVILVSTGCFVIFQAWGALSNYELPPAQEISLFVGCIIATGIWAFTVRPKSVQTAAKDYAKQLLQTLENFQDNPNRHV